jgi:hypothetical protein
MASKHQMIKISSVAHLSYEINCVTLIQFSAGKRTKLFVTTPRLAWGPTQPLI